MEAIILIGIQASGKSSFYNERFFDCYWALRNEDKTVQEATDSLHKLSVAEKNELLWQRGINFTDLPLWQKRGVGLYWEAYQKASRNPLTGEEVAAVRSRLKTELELPMKAEYGSFIKRLLENSSNKSTTE